jgi:hypothetical protein
MAMQETQALALGRPRRVTYDPSPSADKLAIAIAARSLGTSPALIPGWDTSENLSSSAVQSLRALRAYGWGARYVPLYGQNPAVGIQAAEASSILLAGFGLFLVQFARTGTPSQSLARSDGQIAGEYAQALGLKVCCLVYDCAIFSSASDAINCSNAWYGGAVASGYSGALTRVYYEPGVPLTSQERYQDVAFPGYWITAANDPNKWPATRGGQLIQLWPGDRTVAPGVLVDNDAAQEDYLGSYPVAAFAA